MAHASFPLPHARVTRSRLVAGLAAGGLLAGVVVAAASPPRTASATPPGSRDVIANLFEWPWASVAAECTAVLGPKGYGGVQVSPPEESVTLPGHPWWEVYQPVSYQLTSRMGNRAQFAGMVSSCHAAGVKVYADAVINHMTGQGNTGYGGSTFPDKYTYPGTYIYQDFHHPGDPCPEADNQIHSYGSQTEVQECELVLLADLYTEHDYVRGRLAAYLSDLRSLGVDGFRLDASKHMNPADIAAIEGRMTSPGYIYQEVIYGAGEPVQPYQYEGTGDLLEFRYGTNLKAKFGGGHIADLQTFGQSWGMEPSNKAVVFVDNHDTQRNGSTLSYQDGATYTLANVFELAWDYGTPNIMSSFTFSNSDQGPPSASNGMVNAVSCGNGWQCEHRQRAVANMVGFHNAVAGTPVANWWSDGTNQIAFSRGAAGFVVLNKEGGTLVRTYPTGLPAGTYCDVVHGDYAAGSCSGPLVTVDGSGNATVNVSGMDAVAIDTAARVSGSYVRVTFNENATTYWGQNVFVVGGIPALGSWNTASAVPLSASGYPVWSAGTPVPASTSFQYKYIKKNPDGSVSWESDPNRSAGTGTGPLTLNDTWR
jgi:alpha-amylase